MLVSNLRHSPRLSSPRAATAELWLPDGNENDAIRVERGRPKPAESSRWSYIVLGRETEMISRVRRCPDVIRINSSAQSGRKEERVLIWERTLYLLALDVSGRPRCLTYIAGRASGSKVGSGPYPFLFHAYRRGRGEAFLTDEKFHFMI
jgi:hypothetical protein